MNTKTKVYCSGGSDSSYK